MYDTAGVVPRLLRLSTQHPDTGTIDDPTLLAEVLRTIHPPPIARLSRQPSRRQGANRATARYSRRLQTIFVRQEFARQILATQSGAEHIASAKRLLLVAGLAAPLG